MPKVLFIEWATRGRDFEIALPLMYFFEKILNWEIEYISIFNLPKIVKSNPDLIIMSNTIGAINNLNLSRLIEKSNFSLFSHCSEGMFIENEIEAFVWGWGANEKYFSELLSMQWSKKAYLMASKHFPDVAETYRVSGAIGHDKYQIYRQSRVDVNEYKKVIGYAAYDFITIFQSIEDNVDYMVKRFGGKNFSKTKELAQTANNILKYIISQNKDILFILKPHPSDGEKLSFEFHGLLNFSNILILDKDISIAEAISISDIWLNVNSTSNLEAWLLNKPSITFIPFEEMFATDVIYGSLIENNPEKIQSYIEEFYSTRLIKKFEEKKDLREKLIHDYIGFSDGLNHIRYMSFLKPYIEKAEQNKLPKGKWKISISRRLKGYVQYILYSLAKGKYKMPILKRWARPWDIFNDLELKQQKELRYPDFDDFYTQHKNQIDDIYHNYADNWKTILGITE